MIIVYYFVTRLFENYSTQEDFDPNNPTGKYVMTQFNA